MSSTTGRRYLQLFQGGPWGFSVERKGVEAFQDLQTCGWSWGRVGGLSGRVPSSLECPAGQHILLGLRFQAFSVIAGVFSGSALNQPSVLSMGAARAGEAVAGTKASNGGNLAGLALLPSSGWRSAAGFPEMPMTRSSPGLSESCSSPCAGCWLLPAACDEGGVRNHPVVSSSALAQGSLLSQQNSLGQLLVVPGEVSQPLLGICAEVLPS